MARYMIMVGTFLELPGQPPRMFVQGEVVEFKGVPGCSMAPLDAVAIVAHEKAIAAEKMIRERRKLAFKLNVEGLPPTLRRRVEAARITPEAA